MCLTFGAYIQIKAREKTTLLSFVPEVQANAGRCEKEIKVILFGEEAIKLSPIADNMIMYLQYSGG